MRRLKFFALLMAFCLILSAFSSCGGLNSDTDDGIGSVQGESESQAMTDDTDRDTVQSEKSEDLSDGEEVGKGETNAPESSEANGADSSEIDTDAVSEDEISDERGEDSAEFSITESDGKAQFLAASGFSYCATGYIAANETGFVINHGFEIAFGDDVCNEGAFNRINFRYSSEEPLAVRAVYSVDGEEVGDLFFFEASEGCFRGIIEGYLNGKSGTRLEKLIVSTCQKTETDFVLYGIEVDTIPVYGDDITVENDRYKIGVRLSFGGAMTYFEDKLDGDDELTNLVNIHDTGRLIQQSFYGTYTNNEYTSGAYHGTKWPYNPVQGGNIFQSGQPRLVDLEVGEDYIYVKVQSLDWALDNSLTYTYYENTYTLHSSHVTVDNKMVDFSGWTHVVGCQEIPAVYVVSYFGTLAYYNGKNPWTNDEEGVIYADSMGSWGSSLTIPLVEGNSETWAAWLNEDDGFCFGVYTPNVDRLVAIRHDYNGSKDPMSNSCSYVATSSLITMESYLPVEYSYILATGSLQEVREVFGENKDCAVNESLDVNKSPFRISSETFDMTNLDLSVEGNEAVFNGHRVLDVAYDEGENATRFTLTDESDPFTYLDFYWNSDRVLYAEDFDSFEIEYMIPATNSKSSYYLTLFLCAGEIEMATSGYSVSGSLVADGAYHTLTVSLPAEKWSGKINKIRLDIVDNGAVGDEIFVKSIKLLNTPKLGAVNDMSRPQSDKIIGAANRTHVEYDYDQQALKLEVINSHDVGVELDFSKTWLMAEDYTVIEVTYMIPTANSRTNYSTTFFLCTGEDNGYASARSASGGMVADGEYHTMTVTLEGKSGWSGAIKKIRFDYFGDCAVGDVVYIKSIELK